ncbi:MAG: MlaD family protein [Planctomycetota bacterium]
MPSYRRNEIVSGLLVVVALVVFALLSFRVGAFDLAALWRREGALCRTWFDDALTLEAGASVVVAGVPVGRVVGLRLGERDGPSSTRGHAVEVTFAIDSPDLRLDPAGARVRLTQDGFLGLHYLALDPGRWPADRPPAVLGAEEEPVAIRSEPAPGFDTLVAASLPILQRVDRLLARVDAELLHPDSVASARSALEAFAAAVDSVRALLSAENPQGVQSRLLDPLQQLIAHADAAALEAPALLSDGRQSIADVQELVAELRGVVEANGPKVQALLDDLAALSQNADTQLSGALTEASGALQDVRSAVAENRAGLAETVRRLRRTMWQAEMALRKVRANPAILLFGDDEADLEAGLVDHGALWRSGRAKPYEQRDERGSGK